MKKEQLRNLGISPEKPGIAYMRKMLDGTIKTQNLTDKQIDEVLDAWNSRHFVPNDMKEEVDHVSPPITQEELEQKLFSQEDYNRIYVELIEKYLKTIS